MNGQNSEVYLLQKKLMTTEAIFKKEKALLEQKIQLLRIELQEVSEREANQAKIYEIMIQALKPSSDSNFDSIFKQLEQDRNLRSSEIKEFIDKFSNSSLKLEQITNLMKEFSTKNEIKYTEKLKSLHKSEIDYLKGEYETKIK